MPNLEIEGTLMRKMGVQSGNSARGAWEKQEFLVECQEGRFPTQVVFTAWGQDKVSELNKFQLGSQVKVAFNINCREFNGKWYTDLRMWRISAVSAQAQPDPSAGPMSVPAGFQAAPSPSIEDMPADNEEEDLPF